MNIKTLLATFLTVFALVNCGGKGEYTLFPEDVQLKSGDIVLRCGSGITSRAVLYADGGGSYSHVGIVVDSAGVKMIVHAVPDEHDSKDDIDKVKMERPEKFFSSMRTSNGRIMRCQDSITAQRAGAEAYRLYRKTIYFDHDYDDRDSTKMYCCELVEFAYQKAGMSIVGKERHDINLPAFSFDHVMLPSDFLNSEHLTTIRTF